MALAALLVPAGGAAAAELLVMPYACTMADGQPVLTPSPERGHRILGRRGQQQFTACSPVNPDMCRTWTLHRFDLDCDGERASWVSVMAATEEGSRRAWLLGGRFLLRMAPRWSLAPDDPCARARDGDEGFAFRRQCADRLASAPPAVVEMPFGYAPMLGIDAIFVKANPRDPDDAQPPALPPIVAGPAPAETASTDERPVAPARPAPERAPVAEAPLRTPPAPAPARTAAKPAPQSAAAPTTASPKVPSAARPAPTAATPPSRPPRAQEAPETATKAARSKPRAEPAAKAPAKVAAAQAPAAPTATAPATPSPVPEARKAPRAEPAAAPPPPPKRAKRPTAQPEPAFSLNLLSVFRATTTGAIVAFAGLALGLLAAFAVARRREHARDAAGRRRRDVSSLSLDGKRNKPAARAGGGRGRPAPQTAPAATGSEPAQSAASKVADWGDRMPRTREEALEVLGIGIAPSATDVAIKKIVDGLRMSWHPDHAKDETDRAVRELRSKQINAAWALLQPQRTQHQRAEV